MQDTQWEGGQNNHKCADITYGWLLPILVKDSMRLHSSSPFSQIIPGPPHRYRRVLAASCMRFYKTTLFIAWIFGNSVRDDFEGSEIDYMLHRHIIV